MYKIRAQNLRSLRDTGFIDIKPLTVLVGKNSSGKSSFLRIFPLLRQSFEKKISSPLLFSGDLEKDYVDFGGFKHAITKGDDKEIVFSFNSEIRGSIRGFNPNHFFVFVGKRMIKSEIHIRQYVDGKGEYVSEFGLYLFDHCVKIKFDENGSYKIHINNNDYTSLTKDIAKFDSRLFVPQIVNVSGKIKRNANYSIDDGKSLAEEKIIFFEKEIYKKIKSFFKERLHSRTSDSKIEKIMGDMAIDSSDNMLKRLNLIDSKLSSFKELVNEWSPNSGDFKYFADLVVLYSLGDILEIILDEFEEYFEKCFYIAPVRARAARSYVQQSLAVNEIDYNGNNLPMYLYSLDEAKIDKLRSWTKENFDFEPEIQVNDGRISIYIKSDIFKEPVNLADVGFGYSQILPVIVQLWSLSENFNNESSVYEKNFWIKGRDTTRTFLIEQPELHLHPALQAKLLDAFTIAIEAARKNKINLNIVIETHSSTMIDRIGYNIEKRNISNEDVNVVIFDKADNNIHSEVSLGKFDSDGYLENWPLGFFTPEEV